MAAESTFDIVSEFDRQELTNAVDQTQREVRTRYDLKDSKAEIVLSDKDIAITAGAELHVSAVRDILETKALRRNLSLKIFKWGTLEEIGGMRVRQVATLIRDNFPKVQPRIQGDALRIGSKSRDDLQGVIKLVKEHQDEFAVALQFTNYR
jgi:uncharacterized protein YajQ (UPF0234 family)